MSLFWEVEKGTKELLPHLNRTLRYYLPISITSVIVLFSSRENNMSGYMPTKLTGKLTGKAAVIKGRGSERGGSSLNLQQPRVKQKSVPLSPCAMK